MKRKKGLKRKKGQIYLSPCFFWKKIINLIPFCFSINTSVRDMLMLKSEVALFIIPVLLLLISGDGVGETMAGNVGNEFHVFKEIQVSSPEMNCAYIHYDYTNVTHQFDFPKVYFDNSGKPVIIFVDMVKKQIVIGKNLFEGGISFSRFDQLREDNSVSSMRWPWVFQKDKNINFVFPSWFAPGGMNYSLRLYKWDQDSDVLKFKQKIKFTADMFSRKFWQHSGLYGVYPLGGENVEKYLIVGSFIESRFHPFAVLSGEFPSFNKNFTMEWDKTGISEVSPIEEKGWFGVWAQTYEISYPNIVHCAWFRVAGNYSLIGSGVETLRYSLKNGNHEWAEPIEVFSAKEEESPSLRSSRLAMVSDGLQAHLLWAAPQKGIYYAHFDNGKKVELINLTEGEDLENIFFSSPCFDISKDKSGSLYMVWLKNMFIVTKAESGKIIKVDSSYEIILRTKVHGKWLAPVVITSGRGDAILPDLNIDAEGNLHLAYLRENQPIDDTSCHYLLIQH